MCRNQYNNIIHVNQSVFIIVMISFSVFFALLFYKHPFLYKIKKVLTKVVLYGMVNTEFKSIN